MRRFLKQTVAALVAACLSSVAVAALSVADLAAPGDGLLTVDSQTGLGWLDISATRGMSLADVVAPSNGLAPNWLSQGFRFATASELDQLVQHGAGQLDFMAWMGAWAASPEVSAYLGGATTVLDGVLAGDGLRADGLVRADALWLTRDTRINSGEIVSRPPELGGDWIDAGGPQGAVQGPVLQWEDLVHAGASSGEGGAAGEAATAFPDRNFGDFLRRRTLWVSPMQADVNRGVFLVKGVSPVPEPGTWALMGLGLVGLYAVRRPARVQA